MFCEVYLLDTPYHIDRPFDYSCEAGLTRGSIVRVPFGRAGKTRLGVVTTLKESCEIPEGVTAHITLPGGFTKTVGSGNYSMIDERPNKNEA